MGIWRQVSYPLKSCECPPEASQTKPFVAQKLMNKNIRNDSHIIHTVRVSTPMATTKNLQISKCRKKIMGHISMRIGSTPSYIIKIESLHDGR